MSETEEQRAGVEQAVAHLRLIGMEAWTDPRTDGKVLFRDPSLPSLSALLTVPNGVIEVSRLGFASFRPSWEEGGESYNAVSRDLWDAMAEAEEYIKWRKGR